MLEIFIIWIIFLHPHSLMHTARRRRGGVEWRKLSIPVSASNSSSSSLRQNGMRMFNVCNLPPWTSVVFAPMDIMHISLYLLDGHLRTSEAKDQHRPRIRFIQCLLLDLYKQCLVLATWYMMLLVLATWYMMRAH